MNSDIRSFGQVLIIDDNKKEAEPLVNAFAAEGLATLYFTGISKEFPSEKLEGIRLVCLDLQLHGSTTDPKSIISTIERVLESLISPNNGPYILLYWSRHELDYSADVKKSFESRLGNIRPTMIFSLEKTDFIQTQSDGTFKAVPDATRKIGKKIKKELGKSGAFRFLVQWENSIRRAGEDSVKRHSEYIQLGLDWSKKTCAIFKKLAESYAGANLELGRPTQVFRNALRSMSSTFYDDLMRAIEMEDLNGLKEVEYSGGVDSMVISKVNKSFLICNPVSKLKPGNVFKLQGKSRDYRTNLLRDSFNLDFSNERNWEGNEKILTEAFLCCQFLQVEISPVCDWAQNKWKNNHFLHGFLIHGTHSAKIKTKSNFLHIFPTIEVEGRECTLIFDFRKLHVSRLRATKATPIFALRQEGLAWIQNSFGVHLTRQGLQFVK